MRAETVQWQPKWHFGDWRVGSPDAVPFGTCNCCLPDGDPRKHYLPPPKEPRNLETRTPHGTRVLDRRYNL